MKFLGVFGLVLFLAVMAFGQSPVSVFVGTQSSGPAIPADFEGVSFETANLQFNGGGVNGYLFDSTNTEFVTLFQNLGIRHLRIGGTSTDTNNSIWKLYQPQPADVDALFRFAEAADVKIIFSLRLENGDTNQDSSIAQYVCDNYRSRLTCFAIGNEPNIYGNGDPTITNATSYVSRWQTFANAVTNVIPDAKFGGPDSAGTSWASNLSDAESSSGRLSWIFTHWYVGGSSHNLTPQTIIDNVLSPTWPGSKYPSMLTTLNSIGPAHGIPFQLTELNSYVADYPGVEGGNNVFATSLFAVDCMHWFAAHGAPGVHIHTFLGKYNGTFYRDANGNYQLYPIGYGIKAFDVGGHGNVQPVTITNSDSLNLTAYGVGDSSNTYVTIINKEHDSGARDASVTIQPEGFVNGIVDVMFLTAASAAATNSVTLGGASIPNNAAFAGQWSSLGGLNNGRCVITVPATSAAIVRIHADSEFVPPVIVRDLPAQAVTVPGKAYRYSIAATGGSPLHYQWFQNGGPIFDATNSTYLAPATNASIDVVVTNVYGSVTSIVSALTVVPQLTNGYARQVLGYNPVGYWPLQETNAAAPATIETNYGTLGSAGNAIYAAANDGTLNVTLGQTGALGGSGDSNPAAQFSGASASYALVPRASSAVTLHPPLTLEAWVKSSSTAFGDIMGEGGSGLNAQANSGNFGGIRMGYGGNFSGGPNLVGLVYTGNGGAYNNTSTNIQTPANSLALNQWHHCAMTYDGTNVLLYVDGQLQGSGTTPMAIDTWSPLTIGAGRWQGAPTRSFNGSLDEVAVYTNILSATRIQTHYAAGTTATLAPYYDQVQIDHPLLYYRMDSQQILPDPTHFPVAVNFGTAPIDGSYMFGVPPGASTGPAILGWPSAVSAPVNGLVSCVTGGNDPAFNPTGLQPFTGAIWFKCYPSDGRVQTLMSHGSIASWSLNLLGTNGAVSWTSGGVTVASTNSLNDGNWHYVAGVYDGFTNYLYVDGALNNLALGSGNIVGNTNDLWLGGDPDHTSVDTDQRYFAGSLAHATFFTNALSATSIRQLYDAAIHVNSNPTNLQVSASNNLLTLSWPEDHIGWRLQSSTAVGAGWNDVAGANSTNVITQPIGSTQVYYRLAYP